MVYFGVAIATISLAIGLFFFIFYAARYYVFTATVLFLNLLGRNSKNGDGNGKNGDGNRGNNARSLTTIQNGKTNGQNGNGHDPSGMTDDLLMEPFVSIHLPLYNEPNVAERLLTACTTLEYRNYEVVVIDDSTDQTAEILRGWAESNQVPVTLTDGGSPAQVQIVETVLSHRTPVKIVHRTKRDGFKGGALNEALKHMNPKAEYVIIFDADFIPPPDIIRRFLAFFATSTPHEVLVEVVRLDREYAEGRISLEEYLARRQSLSSKLTENRLILESVRVAQGSLFELDQLFADRKIDQDEYLVRRRAIMRELKKPSWTSEQSSENKLALRQSFTVCKLFAEDKIDSSEFKLRMKRISPGVQKRVKPESDAASVVFQILELDQALAKGSVDLKAYLEKRENLAARLLVLSEDPQKLKGEFELNQAFAQGEITPEDYARKLQGKLGNGGNGNGSHSSPDRIVQLISRNSNGGNGKNGNSNGHTGNGERNGYVAVQGYQLHYLNRSENWLTQGIRAEFSGNYMIERTCEELFGAMKMIAGSVYMIKADALREYGWAQSITEDWELTCRLYRDGHRIIYSPTIQAPAECPSTVNRLIRQRQRWAEGHTYNAKRYFWSILKSPHVTLREKLEFLYFAPYYLQSLFFVAGTFLWLISEYIHQYPPFWNPIFGWALLLSNLMALPLMNISGLLSEGTAKKDISGVFSAIVIGYVLSIFQAYAALKGLLEYEEGTWVRTYKTGVITETMRKFQLGKFWRSLTKPSHKSTKAKAQTSRKLFRPTLGGRIMFLGSRGRASLRIVVVVALGLSLIMITGLSLTVREGSAIPTTTLYFYNNGGTTIGSAGTLSETAPSATSQSLVGGTTYYWASALQYSLSSSDNGNWVFHLVYQSSDYPNPKTIALTIYLSSSATTLGSSSGSNTLGGGSLNGGGGTIDVTMAFTFPFGSGGSYYIQFSWGSDAPGSKSVVMTTSSVGSTLVVPENALILAALAAFIPLCSRRKSHLTHVIRRSFSCRLQRKFWAMAREGSNEA